MDRTEAVWWLSCAAVVVLLVALDSKSKMTWLGIAIGVAAVVVALYAGIDLRRLASR